MSTITEILEQSGVRLPRDGQRIKFRTRDLDWREGTVHFVWLALDEPAINVLYETEPYTVCTTTIFPTLGDEWGEIARRIEL